MSCVQNAPSSPPFWQLGFAYRIGKISHVLVMSSAGYTLLILKISGPGLGLQSCSWRFGWSMSFSYDAGDPKILAPGFCSLQDSRRFQVSSACPPPECIQDQARGLSEGLASGTLMDLPLELAMSESSKTPLRGTRHRT